MKRLPELLAPAGSMEAVTAAVQSGCDAIYCGLHSFSARASAVNFSMEEMAEVIRYCHTYGVKVYITMNTLINDGQMDEVESMIVEAARKGADAFIVQDFGLMNRIHQRYPSIELHASTQMNVHHPSHIHILHQAGISRFVIARETPIEIVNEFVSTQHPIEVFIHGALCMSYSGQCAMSYIIGSRSANKGECAQPCRLPYQLVKKQNDRWISVAAPSPYLLSTADLNTLDQLDELVSAGVSSLKIEGRLKRPEYVAAVVQAYRKKLDDPNASTQAEQKAMAQMFNRHFTKGHLFHDSFQLFVSGEKPNHIGTPLGIIDEIKGQYMFIIISDKLHTGDGIRVMNALDEGMTVSRMWSETSEITTATQGARVRIRRIDGANVGDRVNKTTNSELIERLREQIESQPRTRLVTGHFTASVGNVMKLTVSDGRREIEVSSSDPLQSATNRSTSKDEILKQLNKTFDTPYRFERITFDIDSMAFIPVSKINALRRDALIRLQEQPVIEIIREERIDSVDYVQPPLTFRFSCTTAEQIDQVISAGFDQILISNSSLASACELRGIPYVWQTPRIHPTVTFDHATEWVIGEIGQIAPGRVISGDWPLNVTNTESVKWLLSLGLRSVMLSSECTFDDIESIMKNGSDTKLGYLPCEVAVYGRREMMVMKHCPIAQAANTERLDGCEMCVQQEFALKDRKNMIYPLIKDETCTMHVFEHQPLDNFGLAQLYFDVGIRMFRVTFTDETAKEVMRVVNKCVSLTKNLQQNSNL